MQDKSHIFNVLMMINTEKMMIDRNLKHRLLLVIKQLFRT